MSTLPAEIEITGTPVVLYRLYDASDVLLRVGVSENPGRRFEDYEAETSWWPSVVRRTAQWYPDRESALEAETAIITGQRPEHNHMASRRSELRQKPRYPLDHEPEAVKYARKATGLTMRQLAHAIGCSISLISEIEKGTRNATPGNLQRIAAALGCPVVALERKREASPA